MKVDFFVHGVPAPAGSKKGFYIKKINRVVMSPASKKTKPWMESVRWAAIHAGEDEFLAYTCLPDGQTVSQWVQPQIQTAMETGKMPKLLTGL